MELNKEEKPINQVLIESQKNIEEKTLESIKKRGRPAKSGTNSGSTVAPQAILGSASVVSSVPVDYTGSLKAIFEFSGTYLATITKHKEFELSDDESKLLSEQGNEVIKQFAPQINSKYATLGMFTISLCGIFGMKYMSYKMVVTEKLEMKGNVIPLAEVKEWITWNFPT